MRPPRATYRVQFNQDFRFAEALALVPELERLGVSHLYASPVFAARSGSTHGYDVIDPNRLNPVLGSDAEFDRLACELRSRGMGIILDIVPNHMAASPENAWWMDVLENGPASPYAGYFGVNWGASEHEITDKIFLPLLGAPYGAVLENGELRLEYEPRGFCISYYQHKLPVGPATYLEILQPLASEMRGNPAFDELYERIGNLPPRYATEWDALEARTREKESIKVALQALHAADPRFRAALERTLRLFNGRPGDPRSFDLLHDLLERQAYRLAFWKVATEQINYRRFFDVAELIGMRVERAEVFEAAHRRIFEFVKSGKVDGLRVDHIDGLADPRHYLDRLRDTGAYIVAEKILVRDERLPEDWPIQGTTGYDFLGHLNALFVDAAGLDAVTRGYKQMVGSTATFEDVEYERKRHVIDTLFTGEMLDLGSHLVELAQRDRHARDLSPKELSTALIELTACMPVYRTYTHSPEVDERDRARIREACSEARRRKPALNAGPLEFAARVLQLDFPPPVDTGERERWLAFVMKWQQITGPIMAKGVEDSTFYVYLPFVSLNEVGGSPHAVSAERMHAFLAERRRRWPASMNATSTHDTKRSEDVRARLNVLSEMPGEWIRMCGRWSRWLSQERKGVDRNEEYLLFQTLVGAWPLSAAEEPEFERRMQAYVTKAAREARVHTSWLHPNEDHERALVDYVHVLFHNARFLARFRAFVARVSFYGAVNSLAQVLVKTTAPGIPDFYRGTIAWDFSLVDPDNRRPVDFVPLTDFAEPADKLLASWRDGRVKVFVTEKALAYRKGNEALFTEGEYVPLEVTGRRARHVFAFARRHGTQWCVVIVPRLSSQLSVVVRAPLGIRAWHDTVVHLPAGAPLRWRDVITGRRQQLRSHELPLHRILDLFPCALLSAHT